MLYVKKFMKLYPNNSKYRVILKLAAKRMYYQNQLSRHKNNLSKQWSIMNEIITNNQKYQEMIATIAGFEKEVVSDKSTICSVLNDFFVNVGLTMNAKMAQPCKNFHIPNVIKSFAYEPITNEEVYLKLSQLDPRKANGPEIVPNKFLKLLSPISGVASQKFRGGAKLHRLVPVVEFRRHRRTHGGATMPCLLPWPCKKVLNLTFSP